MALPIEVRRIHAAAAEAAEALGAAVRGGALPDGYPAMRMRFAGAVRDGLGMYQTVYSRLSPEQRQAIPAIAAIADAEREIRLTYSQHIAHWTSKAIEQDFAGYAKVVQMLVARLHYHIRQLETDFYEHAFALLDAPAGQTEPAAPRRRTAVG